MTLLSCCLLRLGGVLLSRLCIQSMVSEGLLDDGGVQDADVGVGTVEVVGG